MNRYSKVIILFSSVLLLAACSGFPVKNEEGQTSEAGKQAQTEDAAQNTKQTGNTTGDGSQAHGLEDSKGINGTVINNPNCAPDCVFRKDAIFQTDSPLAVKIIYFDFDKSKIKAEFLPLLEQHATYLLEYPEAKVRLEGHSDERGSREYNIALGERRAKAVKRFLQLKGVADEQISIVSFGEELPARLGHNEEAWALNRRVEIIYE